MRFLLVDHITELEKGKLIRGVKHITTRCPLANERTTLPYFIPSFIGETLGQLAAWNVMLTQDFKARPVAGLVDEAILKRPVYVGETLMLESYIDKLDETAVEYHSVASVDGETVFEIAGALGPLLPMQDFIDDTLIRAQFKSLLDEPKTALSSISNAHPQTLFAFDSILCIEPGQQIRAEKYIDKAAPYFPDHFPNQAVLPLTVLLEYIRRLSFTFVKQSNFTNSYRLHSFRKIKMKSFVHPGSSIYSTLSVKEQTPNELILKSQTDLRDKRVCMLELVFVKDCS